MADLDGELLIELNRLDELHLRRSLRTFSGLRVANFSSNDYLGLSTHPEVLQASMDALTYGLGAGAARLLSGNFPEHLALEEELARLKQTQACLLFSTGYHANVGTISALVGPNDAVFSDALNHASLVDGCRLSGARIYVYRHCDVEHLSALLQDSQHFRRRLIVTDAIFGMDGDSAPLCEIEKLANRHRAIWMVDEAHATGVQGPNGRGLSAKLGVSPTVNMGTFGKALGCFGAFVCGTKTLCDYLLNRARTFIFTTALPPAIAAGARRAVQIVSSAEGDRLRTRLNENARMFASGLQELGFRVPPTDAHIFPVIVGDAARALSAADALFAKGILAQAIRPPTVPEGKSRLRFAPTAAHTPEQIGQTLAALSQLRNAIL